jgi:hypothetical protein
VVCDGPVTVTLWHKKSHLARYEPGATRTYGDPGHSILKMLEFRK